MKRIVVWGVVVMLCALVRSKTLLRPESSDPIRQHGVQGQVLAITSTFTS